jgi:aspartate aminotransferase-like enzyme
LTALMRGKETKGLQAWRQESKAAVTHMQRAGSVFSEYLMLGGKHAFCADKALSTWFAEADVAIGLANTGPDAIKSLQNTVRRLQQQVEDTKADKRLEKFRKLQKDLEVIVGYSWVQTEPECARVSTDKVVPDSEGSRIWYFKYRKPIR